MILQALVEHYEDLAVQGKLARPGWSDSKISYALYINDAGELEQAASLKVEEDRGKKKALVPRSMSLPAPVKRTVDIVPNFLWDNSSYILGIDEKGKPQRSLESFTACKALHHQLLDGVDSPAARALLAFFDRWDPLKAREHPALVDKLEDILAGANLVFRYDGAFVQEDPLVRASWQDHYDAAGDGPEMVCLATGKKGPAEAVHPAIKGVAGAQSSGAALISFNAPAFCSYGRDQNLNAPVGKYAAFAYTSALNYLLADRNYVGRIGDTTVLFWARGGERAYQGFAAGCLFGLPTPYEAQDLQKKVLDLCQGKSVQFDETRLDPETKFYILGLSPNSARLSVRFFLENSFGYFIRNVQAHQERLEIVRPSFDKFDTLPLWKLLDETVNQNARAKSPVPGLAGETLRAVLTDTPYPATLLNGVTLRIRAEREVTRGRAAILKACLLKKYELSNQKPEFVEVLKNMEFDEKCKYPPFVLGQLFAVMERIQLASADWKLNRSIKDSYFNTAAATPNLAFFKLFPLSEHHMKKLKRDKPYFARDLEEEKKGILGKMTASIPTRFTPDETNCFYIGYYYQKCKMENTEQKKEEK